MDFETWLKESDIGTKIDHTYWKIKGQLHNCRGHLQIPKPIPNYEIWAREVYVKVIRAAMTYGAGVTHDPNHPKVARVLQIC